VTDWTSSFDRVSRNSRIPSRSHLCLATRTCGTVRTHGGAYTRAKWLDVEVPQEQWIRGRPVQPDYEAMIRDVLARRLLSLRMSTTARTSRLVTRAKSAATRRAIHLQGQGRIPQIRGARSFTCPAGLP